MTSTQATGPDVVAVCGHEITDGNHDDPSYAYCGLPRNHAGQHHYSTVVAR